MNTTSAENSSSSLSEPSDDGYVPITVVLASVLVNLILSPPLNGFVIWLILRAPRESVASDFFSLNLAMSDFLVCLFAIWFFIFLESKSLLALGGFRFSLGLLLTARPLFQCCICMEYYAGVVHPVLYLRFKPLRYKLACCCVMWIIILLSCISSLCIFLNPLYLHALFLQSVLLFCVMLFCSLSVLRALKRPGPGDKVKGKKTTNKMKRKAFKIILLIMISMTMNFFLYIVVIPLQFCLEPNLFKHVFGIFSTLALTTGFIQPLLYLHRSGKLPCVEI